MVVTKTSSRTPMPPGAQNARNPAHHARQYAPATTHHFASCSPPSGSLTSSQIARLCHSSPTIDHSSSPASDGNPSAGRSAACRAAQDPFIRRYSTRG